jgi:pentapeptide MXKDX repeat protein
MRMTHMLLAFALSSAAAVTAQGQDAMKGGTTQTKPDAMKKDAMGKGDAMKKDAMAKGDAMKHDGMAKGDAMKAPAKKDSVKKDAMKKTPPSAMKH